MALPTASRKRDPDYFLGPQGMRRIAWLLPLLALCLMALNLWRIEAMNAQLQADTLAHEKQHAASLANTKADEIGTLLSRADFVLRQFRNQYAGDRSAATKARIQATFDDLPKGAIIDFSVVDAQGHVEFSTPPATGPLYLGDQAFFKQLSVRPSDALVIDKPVRAKSGTRWLMPLARPLLKGGQFAGVAVVSLEPRFLSANLARLDLPEIDSVSLFFRDGSYVARSRNIDQVQGTQAAADCPFLQPGSAEQGVFSEPAVAGQPARLCGWKKVQGLPLVLTVGLDEDAVLAPARAEIRQTRIRNAISAPLIIALVVGLSWLLLRSADQQHRSQARESLLQATLDSTADGILVVGSGGKVLDSNRRFSELWRIPEPLLAQGQDQALLQHVVDQLSDPEGFLNSVQALYESDERRQDLVPFKDGRIFDRYTQPLQLDGERARLWSFHDVTEYKQIEKRLRQLSMAVEQSPESVVITDLDARIEYVNEAFLRSTGYTREELLGHNPRILQSGHTPPRAFAEMWAALTRGRAWEGELRNRRKDGSEYIESAVIAPIRMPDGRITHYLGVKTDISEKTRLLAELQAHRDRLEELVAQRTAQLAEARDRAEAANQAKSAFLANVSHEIRTPLNAITGMAYLMRRAGLDEAQAARLDKIDAAGRHLIEIINAVLDLSKIDAGRFALEEGVVDIQGLFANVASMLHDGLHAKHLELIVTVPPALPTLLGDAPRLQQALLNYASNAVKFTERGQVTLRAAVVEQTADTLLLRLEVQDSGIGIAAQALPRLFTAFEQADNSTTRKYGGTGLGLSITKRLAELMGGSVGVTSTPGVGSTFWFTARLRKTASPPPPPSPNVGLDAARATLRREHRGRRVLVVEDEIVNREVALAVLSDVGLRCDVARDGIEAVELAGRNRYDLILMDMQMPRLDGLQATRRIRAQAGDACPPVLAMTANAFAEDRQRCREAGMSDFITKPVDALTLYTTLLKWLPATGVAPA
ncbi:MAG: ATP-binding protein [Rubrivivax sp.]|nr:ATP-binding protein [Rubrivivax sp.]